MKEGKEPTRYAQDLHRCRNAKKNIYKHFPKSE